MIKAHGDSWGVCPVRFDCYRYDVVRHVIKVIAGAVQSAGARVCEVRWVGARNVIPVEVDIERWLCARTHRQIGTGVECGGHLAATLVEDGLIDRVAADVCNS